MTAVAWRTCSHTRISVMSHVSRHKALPPLGPTCNMGHTMQCTATSQNSVMMARLMYQYWIVHQTCQTSFRAAAPDTPFWQPGHGPPPRMDQRTHTPAPLQKRKPCCSKLCHYVIGCVGLSCAGERVKGEGGSLPGGVRHPPPHQPLLNLRHAQTHSHVLIMLSHAHLPHITHNTGPAERRRSPALPQPRHQRSR